MKLALNLVNMIVFRKVRNLGSSEIYPPTFMAIELVFHLQCELIKA